ncbi:plasmid stabilization system (plasmid) [Thalassoporum mexicanum PCC 7367]|uniref:type II toxin-antitoxin system RelE/ParE family toxin n=1 Tax=Thalassoporum mexicanum TaxID=3457544 RepID=UPI00029FD304|nr:type II toxin-antitoxin system RelE/ParE family toxin [Pseudanabaena sp. PCC 7367]AFY72068.1 plasmid stabilization system [Pseudanabaena sp. PCC 7367]
MAKLIWSFPAKADLDRHYYYLAAHEPSAARKAIKAISKAAKRLASMPYLGAVLEEKSSLRKWPVSFGKYGYVIHYTVTNNAVVIDAVYHGREERSY